MELQMHEMNIDQIGEEQKKLTAELTEIEGRIVGLQRQIAESDATIATLNGDYEAACVAIASGKEADPSAPAAARDRESHRLHGLKQLWQKESDSCAPVALRHQELSVRLARLQEDEQDAVLLAAHQNKHSAWVSAQKATEAARLEVAEATKQLDTFRNGVAGRARRRAQGLG